jgi:hypothetical protein
MGDWFLFFVDWWWWDVRLQQSRVTTERRLLTTSCFASSVVKQTGITAEGIGVGPALEVRQVLRNSMHIVCCFMRTPQMTAFVNEKGGENSFYFWPRVGMVTPPNNSAEAALLVFVSSSGWSGSYDQ